MFIIFDDLETGRELCVISHIRTVLSDTNLFDFGAKFRLHKLLGENLRFAAPTG